MRWGKSTARALALLMWWLGGMTLSTPASAYEINDAAGGLRIDLADVKGRVCVLDPEHERNDTRCPELADIDPGPDTRRSAMVYVVRPEAPYSITVARVDNKTEPLVSKEHIEGFVRGVKHSMEAAGQRSVTSSHELLKGPYDGMRLVMTWEPAAGSDANAVSAQIIYVYPRERDIVTVAFATNRAALARVRIEASVIMAGAQFELPKRNPHFGKPRSLLPRLDRDVPRRRPDPSYKTEMYKELGLAAKSLGTALGALALTLTAIVLVVRARRRGASQKQHPNKQPRQPPFS